MKKPASTKNVSAAFAKKNDKGKKPASDNSSGREQEPLVVGDEADEERKQKPTLKERQTKQYAFRRKKVPKLLKLLLNAGERVAGYQKTRGSGSHG